MGHFRSPPVTGSHSEMVSELRIQFVRLLEKDEGKGLQSLTPVLFRSLLPTNDLLTGCASANDRRQGVVNAAVESSSVMAQSPIELICRVTYRPVIGWAPVTVNFDVWSFRPRAGASTEPSF